MRDRMKTQHKREQSGYGRILRAFVACVGCGALALPALAGSDEVKRDNGIFYQRSFRDEDGVRTVSVSPGAGYRASSSGVLKFRLEKSKERVLAMR